MSFHKVYILSYVLMIQKVYLLIIKSESFFFKQKLITFESDWIVTKCYLCVKIMKCYKCYIFSDCYIICINNEKLQVFIHLYILSLNKMVTKCVASQPGINTNKYKFLWRRVVFFFLNQKVNCHCRKKHCLYSFI